MLLLPLLQRRKELGMPDGDGDPALEGMSDSEWEPPEDPPELVAARKRLAQYTARPGEEEPPELLAERSKQAKGGGIVQVRRCWPEEGFLLTTRAQG